MSRAQLLAQLEAHDITVSVDSMPIPDNYIYKEYLSNPNPKYDSPFYRIEPLIIGADTIKNLQFPLKPVRPNKTKVYLNGTDIPKGTLIPKLQKQFRKEYRILIEAFLSDHLETD